MQPLRFARLLMPLLAAGLLAACSAERDVAPAPAGPETWLPADTLLLARAPSVADWREAWPATAMGQAWSEPGLSFWRERKFEPALAQLARRAGLEELPALLNMLEGEALFALAWPEGDGERPVVHAMLDFGIRAGEARALTAQAWPADESHEIASGKTLLEHGPLVSVWDERRLFLSTDAEALAALLERRDRGATDDDTLAASPAWQAHGAALGGMARLWARPAEVWTRAQPRLAELPGPLSDQARRLGEGTGIDRLQALTLEVEPRGEAFYQRATLVPRPGAEPEGLFFLTHPGPPLATPAWATRDVEAFSAYRLRDLEALRRSSVALLRENFPQSEWMLGMAAAEFRKATGLEPSDLLEPLGGELAMFSRPGLPLPESVIAVELEDPDAWNRSLDTLIATTGILVSDKQHRGLPYRELRLPSIPLPLYVAEREGFFILATGAGWLRAQADRAANAGLPKAEPDDLASLLDEPFGPPLEGWAVVQRGYGKPMQGLARLGQALPLLVPVLNVQLSQYGVGPLPDWVTGALPPFAPFGLHALPTTTRSLQHPQDGRLVQESHGGMDPLATPLSATALVLFSEFLDNH